MITYGFSLEGKSHERKGVRCQDSHKIKTLENGWVIAAVADGVGSAANAHIGSRIAVETVVGFCEKYMPYDYNLISIKSMMRTAYNYALKKIYQKAKEDGNPVESYDTTLTMAVYDGKRIIYGHSGDGAIVGLTRYGNYVQITEPQKGEDGVSVRPLRAGYQEWVIDTCEEDLTAVLLLTDGMLETICPYLIRQDSREVYVPLAMFFADPFCFQGVNDTTAIKEFLKAEETYPDEAFYNRIGMGICKHILNRDEAKNVLESIKKNNYPNIFMKKEQDDKTVVGLINSDDVYESQDAAYYAEPDWQELQEVWNQKAYPHLYEKEGEQNSYIGEERTVEFSSGEASKGGKVKQLVVDLLKFVQEKKKAGG